MMFLGSLIFWVSFIQIATPLQKTTPLRLDDIQSEEVYVRLENGAFKLYIYNSHFITDPDIVFCFRERTISTGKNNVCDLVGVFNAYKCIIVTATQSNNVIITVSATAFDSDSTLTSTAKTNAATIANTSIAIGVSQIAITLTPYLSDNKIYEVYAGYKVNLGNDPLAKNAFFNTFRIANQTNSDDLMAQRHPHCFEFYYQNYINYNLVFYGGVIRGGNDTMFFHVLTFFAHENQSIAIGSNLNGYVGISWSRDHAGRDMAAFITANSTLFDLLSLYYHAPYLDDSIHVQGTTDLQVVTDSSIFTAGQSSHYFYGGFARNYDTFDSFGDELLRKKMNNTYCIAVGFHNLNNSFPYSPVLPANKHLDHGCFTSTVVLWQAATWASLLSVLCLALV